MDRPKPNARKRLLANKLRRLREDAGLTQVEAGEPMRFNKNKMSRIELGHLPDYNGFLALLDRYGVIVSDYDDWVRQYDRAWEKGWWHAYSDSIQPHFATYLGLESAASEIRIYEVSLIPNLLQTEDYARAVIGAGMVTSPQDDIERQVELRMARQPTLTRADPPNTARTPAVRALPEAAARAVRRWS